MAVPAVTVSPAINPEKAVFFREQILNGNLFGVLIV
jgi:hypothetical protein